MKKINFIFAIVFFLAFSLTGSTVYSYDSVESRETLKGIHSMSLDLSALKPEVLRTGISQNQLRNDAEVKLWMVGINILKKYECNADTVGCGRLSIDVETLETSSCGYFFIISVFFDQPALLLNSMKYDLSITWMARSFGNIQNANGIKDIFNDSIDQFVNAWLSVNPK